MDSAIIMPCAIIYPVSFPNSSKKKRVVFLSFDVSSLSSLADAEKGLLVSLAPCGGEALTRLTRLDRLERLARLARLARVARLEQRLPDNAI
jgi:hypothetical protein